MPKRVKCCIPGCGNSYKNKGTLRFFRIPKDPDVRNTYRLLLRDQRVRLDSDGTRICSAHFESGVKRSRTHLPNIFPWNTDEDQRVGEKRKNLENIASVLKTLKKKPTSSLQNGGDGVNYEYPYRVPWRFDDVPMYNGRVSSFKTNEELMQYVVPLNHESTSSTNAHFLTPMPNMSTAQSVRNYTNGIEYSTEALPDIRVEYEPPTHNIEPQLSYNEVSNSGNIINQLSMLHNYTPEDETNGNNNNETDNFDRNGEKRVTIHKEIACQTEISEEDFQLMSQKLNVMRFENRRLKQELEALKRGFCNI